LLNLTFIIPVLASLLILGLVGTLDNAYAEVCHTIADGSWDSAIWENALNNPCTPLESDDKSIDHIVTMSSSVNNSGVIANFGTLTVSATFTNTGDIFNQNIMVFTSTAIVNNNGMFENFGGTVTLDQGGQFNTNFAAGNAHFNNEQGTFTVNGSFTNLGDAHQSTNGVMEISGTLTNTGDDAFFDNRIGANVTLLSGGTLDNLAGAKFDNKSGATLTNKDDVINDGAIINSGTLSNNSGANITNNNGSSLTNNSGATIVNNSGATLRNNPGSTLTNNFGATITNDFGATITNIGTTINNGVILECGTYTGNLPTPNGLVTCIITEDTTISQDLTYPCGFTLTVNSGFVYTIDGDSTVTVCGPVTVKDDGGILIMFGSTLWVLVNPE